MIKSPTQDEIAPARPAPVMPKRGAPKWPKISAMHKTTLMMFMTTEATMCTCVLPMPSKNALNEKVAAIEVMPSKRHFK
jgi:hypothetical protein